MNNEIQLTVIIPMYKGKEYIKKTVEGILAIKQSKQILIIDDGSPDDSFEYCQKLWNDNFEIEILKKENGGIADTRNFGLSKALGKYIIFVDQDDMIVAEVIDLAIRKAELSNAEIVIWSAERKYDSGKTMPCDVVYKERILEKDEICQHMFLEMLLNTNNTYVSYIGHVWTALYSACFIKKNEIRFKIFVDIEDDYLFVLDCLKNASRLVCLPQVGYYWSYNKKSESNRQRYIDNIVKRYENMYKYILETIEDGVLEQKTREKYIIFIKQDVMIRAIENCCTCLNQSKTEKRELLKLVKKYRKVFKIDSIQVYEKRPQRIYILLKCGMVRIAFFYVYLDSIFRSVHSKYL